MEEKNIVDIKEELEEVLNIMQLLEISLTNNEDDEHIIRSLHVLQRMVKSVMDKVQKKETASNSCELLLYEV